ncbi:hypothetical protein [Candidatus Mycoplasma haematohominis]|uniref:hypothetical protein n=1 Tax=Candidatus Mycoplasma haematohominis TaxID=1494318 RepID=UPI001C0A6EE6|nr:hypothetical protein [Candidatus Mycoplasma haemohominis]
MNYRELLVLGTTTLLTAGGASITLSNSYPYLQYIEVYFYDKDGNNNEKIQLAIDDLSQSHKVKFWEKTSTPTKASTSSSKEEKETWKPFDKSNTKHNALYEIAKKFLLVQHGLNVIRSLSWDASKFNSNFSSTTCTKPQTCSSSCICCYSDNQSTNQDCCCTQNNCQFETLKQTQTNFSYLIKNIYSAQKNIYLSPVQAHIKLEDNTFTELENNTTSTNAEYKSFTGTLIYGFIDYSYKPVEYKEEITQLIKESSGTSATNNNDLNKKQYFANIPNKFKFTYKKQSNSPKEDSNEPEDHINKILKTIEKKQVRIEKTKWLKENQDKPLKNCCLCDTSTTTDKDNFLNCLIKRNYVFAEEKDNGLEQIASKIKDSKTCPNKTK